MRRDEAWDFWRLGMQVERADMATRVLDVLADRGADLSFLVGKSSADVTRESH